MTRALVNALREWHDEQAGDPQITNVVLEVGDFTAVEPEALVAAFKVQRRAVPFLETASLSVTAIPLIAYCDPCESEYRPSIGTRYAHSCGEPMRTIRSGRELRIKTIESEQLSNA